MDIPDDILLIGVSKPDGTTDNNILSFVRGMYKACIVTREKECILRSVTDVDVFQSGRFAKQNGRPETHKISSYSCGLITTV